MLWVEYAIKFAPFDNGIVGVEDRLVMGAAGSSTTRDRPAAND